MKIKPLLHSSEANILSHCGSPS
uniref:Uncharacterized protein n=1 Tax=Anguilla anguilla TaxID=7936 RepID=A0A0E9PDZ6_ANGAN